MLTLQSISKTYKNLVFNPVVAINAFPSDTEDEVNLIKKKCAGQGVHAVIASGWATGGEGMTELAAAVVGTVESYQNDFQPLYDWQAPIKEKIEIIAKRDFMVPLK